MNHLWESETLSSGKGQLWQTLYAWVRKRLEGDQGIDSLTVFFRQIREGKSSLEGDVNCWKSGVH